MTILIYGATGFTGRLCAKEARRRGVDVVLAGRNRARSTEVSSRFGFPGLSFELSDAEALANAVRRSSAVLHIAGPFSATAAPMRQACLEAGVHYLDITGELAVLDAHVKAGPAFAQKGICLVSAVGFDTVPSDCLLAHVSAQVGGAETLELAIRGLSEVTRGTAKTALEGAPAGPMQIEDGALRPVKGGGRRRIDFGDGEPVECAAVSWGDLVTARASTGARSITTWFELTPQVERLTNMGALQRFAVSTWPLSALVRRTIDLGPAGPSEETMRTARAELVATAINAAGERARAKLTTPEAYRLTAHTAIDAALRVVAGDVEPGFRSPAMAFGADYILGFEGCQRTDLSTV